jgi:hypothetical protein
MISGNNSKQLKRFQPIEYLAYWEGGVNSRLLAECIDASNLTARKHITEYLEQYPNNLKYNPYTSDKLYVPITDFKLHTISDKWTDYIAFTSSVSQLNTNDLYDCFDRTCIKPLQIVDSKVFRDIYRAVKRKEHVSINYRSKSRPEGMVRSIHPHVFASNGLRWHCRAFCTLDNQFKDFNIGRITEVITSEPSEVDHSLDEQWHNYIELTIQANQKLPEALQRFALIDHGYENAFNISVRKAMVPYFLDYHRISTSIDIDNPNEKPLMVVLTGQIKTLLFNE